MDVYIGLWINWNKIGNLLYIDQTNNSIQYPFMQTPTLLLDLQNKNDQEFPKFPYPNIVGSLVYIATLSCPNIDDCYSHNSNVQV
jgi:hypothetical protein